MKGLELAFGLFLFGLFWAISTPIYFAANICRNLDGKLSEYLSKLYKAIWKKETD